MKSVQVREFGVEHVTVAEVADPSPGQGEVLIATEAATVNPADFAVVTGAAAARLPWGSAPPYTPGWDLAGRVVAVGKGVDPSVTGSRVVGFSLAVVSADDAGLGPAVRDIVPDGADALLDTASIAGPALAAVRDGGKYVTVTALPSPERGIDVFRSGGRMDAPALRTLADMASSGRLHTPVAHAYSIDDARAAYEAFARRTGRGRLVLSFPGT